MSAPYSKIFDEIVNNISSYVCKDFNEIKGINTIEDEANVNFCCSTCRKIIDETVRVLKKVKYNGSLLLANNLYFNRQIAININSCIFDCVSFKKKDIIIDSSNNEIILSTARLQEGKKVKNKIILLPINGIMSFSSNIPDFAITFAYQEIDENDKYITKQVVIYNPITRDFYSFEDNNCFSVNNIRLPIEQIVQERHINSIYVNNYELYSSFDINKLNSISNTFCINDSIFYSLCLLCSTNTNLVIYPSGKDKIVNELIDFCIKSACLDYIKNGDYLAIGKNGVLKKFKK